MLQAHDNLQGEAANQGLPLIRLAAGSPESSGSGLRGRPAELRGCSRQAYKQHRQAQIELR